VPASPEGLKCAPIGFQKSWKITLLRKCTIAVGVLILSPPSSALANCVAHCLLIQRGMDANARGSSVAEWSQSSGIFHEDLGTVEVPLDSIDSECEKAKQNFLENPSISKKGSKDTYGFTRLGSMTTWIWFPLRPGPLTKRSLSSSSR